MIGLGTHSVLDRKSWSHVSGGIAQRHILQEAGAVEQEQRLRHDTVTMTHWEAGHMKQGTINL